MLSQLRSMWLPELCFLSSDLNEGERIVFTNPLPEIWKPLHG